MFTSLADLAANRAKLVVIAAVIVTIVGGAAALVVIVNFAEIAPAGTMTSCGTEATVGSLLNSLALVGCGSVNASVTVPVDDAPPETVDGSTDSDEITPSADAPAGTASSIATTNDTARSTGRRITASLGALTT
jgi:hypothetical protein